MGADLAIREPTFRTTDRHYDAGKAAARPLGWTDQFLCSSVAVLFLFLNFHYHDAARDRSSSHELLFPGNGIFCVPPFAGIPGGSHLGTPGLLDLLGGVRIPGGELPSAGGGDAFRCGGGGWSPVYLPGAVLLCILLQGIHGIGDHDWL